MYKKGEYGFTLIEVIISITIIAVVITTIYFTHLSGWNFWRYNSDKINLSQQKLIIARNLEIDIKNAKNIKIDDLNGDGMDELLINKGDTGNTDLNNYTLYQVENNILKKRIPTAGFTLNGEWPIYSDWTSLKSITENIVTNHNFIDEKGDYSLIYYKFELSKDDQDVIVANMIYPRLF